MFTSMFKQPMEMKDDVLLVGDFNRNPTDADAYSRIMAIPSMTRLFQFPTEIAHQGLQSLRQHLFPEGFCQRIPQ